MNAVEMIDIVKEYPGVLANDHVTLVVREGEIHGLVGENGAGKSTIMNQLYGMQRPTSGTIKVFGNEVQIHSPKDAIALGIGMVHQHFRTMLSGMRTRTRMVSSHRNGMLRKINKEPYQI